MNDPKSRHEALEDSGRVVSLIAEPDRLRVLAAVVLGRATLGEISSATGLDTPLIGRALARLADGGLVEGEGAGPYRVATGELGDIARALAEEEETRLDEPPGAASILRNFIRRGRLTTIPATRSKRIVVLDFLSQRFEPGRRYSEREVNAILGEFHDDYASLRRYLVDEGFMDRDEGQYWRAGGSFPVD